MIRASFRLFAVLLCAAGLTLPRPVQAAMMADPQALYTSMKRAYEQAALKGWNYESQAYYLATIFNAGRAYSLQRPTDPGYAELAQLTVDVASSLHYDPLIDHDAVEWYVREAALFVQKNNADPKEQAKAQQLVDRVDAFETPEKLAQLAIADADGNRAAFPHDNYVRTQQVEAAWRAYLLTKDATYLSQALTLASRPDFPLANMPTTWAPAFVERVNAIVAAGKAANAPLDFEAASSIARRIRSMENPPTIATVKGVTHDAFLSTLAPADEYFGPMGISVLGMRNELNRINANLNLGWGDHESGSAVQLAVAVDALHKVYPRDRDLPKLLFETYTLLGRLHTSTSATARRHMRSLLTVEYQDSPQAKQLLQ